MNVFTYEDGLRPEGPTVNSPGREAGVKAGVKVSAEGAAQDTFESQDVVSSQAE